MHSGSIVHISAAFKVPIVDIVEKEKNNEVDRWIPSVSIYKRVNFENIDNLKYFNLLKKKLSSKFEIVIKKNRFYKGNIFYKQNHYFFNGKKL